MNVADLIKRHEGFRALAYDDASGLTLKPGRQVMGSVSIGFGRNLYGRGVTTAEANLLLDNDLAECRQDLVTIFGDLFTNAAPERQAALIDLRYNVGPMGFRQFVKLIAAVKAGDWESAAQEAIASKVAPIRARDDAALLRSCALP